MEHRDRLWPGGYTFLYDDGLFRPSTDTFLLGAFPRLRRGMAVCELGAGTGLLSLLLLAREPELTVTGVELQPQACALFRRTAEENGLSAHSPEVEVVICLVTIMMAGAVESWLRGELTQTPEELTRRIDMMFQDYIRGVALRLKAPAAVYA